MARAGHWAASLLIAVTTASGSCQLQAGHPPASEAHFPVFPREATQASINSSEKAQGGPLRRATNGASVTPRAVNLKSSVARGATSSSGRVEVVEIGGQQGPARWQHPRVQLKHSRRGSPTGGGGRQQPALGGDLLHMRHRAARHVGGTHVWGAHQWRGADTLPGGGKSFLQGTPRAAVPCGCTPGSCCARRRLHWQTWARGWRPRRGPRRRAASTGPFHGLIVPVAGAGPERTQGTEGLALSIHPLRQCTSHTHGVSMTPLRAC